MPLHVLLFIIAVTHTECILVKLKRDINKYTTNLEFIFLSENFLSKTLCGDRSIWSALLSLIHLLSNFYSLSEFCSKLCVLLVIGS